MSVRANFTVWPGSKWQSDGTLDPSAASPFYVPIYTTQGFVTNETYQWGGGFLPANTAGWEGGVQNLPNLPHFDLLTTNRLQAFILATDKLGNQRVIDYVHFNGPDSQRDLNVEIQTYGNNSAYNNMWDTNSNTGGIAYGIISQLGVSQGSVKFDSGYWTEDPFAAAEIDAFFVFMGGTATGLPVPLNSAQLTNKFNSYYTNLTMQAPFSPTVIAYEYTSWQANDPLVHSLASDINFSEAGVTGTNTYYSPPVPTLPPLLPNIGALNDRYQPWGKSHSPSGSDANGYNMAYKDPLVRQSDDWDLPANKFPSVGWLGRVHRGTPWQTVFLKATNILAFGTAARNGINTWKSWTGNINTYDATNTTPVQDRLLFDLFSTALNDNATRGQLPINMGAADTGNPAAGLAAWSAVFSGVTVLSNTTSDFNLKQFAFMNPRPPITYTAQRIDPAGVNAFNSPLMQLVTNINFTRAHLTNDDGVVGAFEHVGDILAVRPLTERSPFLNRSTGTQVTNGINDALYEWLPQQVMSLLRLSNQPRFVIYSYGQTLTPAPNGVVTSSGLLGPNYSGMITNYQVVAETVTRSVVRIEGAPTNTHAVVESYNILPPD